MLHIKDIVVETDGIEILKKLNLEVHPGKVHAIMGPNGAGKSTLAKFLAGHPDYTQTQGEVLFENEPLEDLEVEERAQKGLFVGFQYPTEVPGVTNRDFLKAALDAKAHSQGEAALTEEQFEEKLEACAKALNINFGFADRFVNEGFSGGEKKKSEILQLLLLQPKIAILDETDSGLDIDAMKIVSDGVLEFMNPERSLVLITHYQRLLDYIKPDFIHVMIDGKIVLTESGDFAQVLEEKGYDWITTSSGK